VTLAETQQAIADALRPIGDVIDDLQVYPYWNDTPSPPALDVYPATPFRIGAGFGVGSVQLFYVVRARVGLNDPEAAQLLLLRFLDVNDDASVEAALVAADAAVVDNSGQVNGFRTYGDDATDERMLGVDWQVTTFS
jgi:hypothetical protein